MTMDRMAVLVVCDSLRADLVDAGTAPTLARLRDEGRGLTCLSAGKPDFLDRLRRATGRALGRPTLHERVACLGEADGNVARVLEHVERLGPGGDRIFFAVCSDHGMQTIRRRIDVGAKLVEAGFKSSADSSDVVVAPQGTSVVIHLADEARPRLAAIAQWLERQDFAGQVVVGEALSGLGLPSEGTLSIAVSLAGDDEANPFGVRGRSDVAENALGGESLPGHGQHGGLGHYEQKPFLAVRGAGFARCTHATAASLIDLAPTILRHLALPRNGMDGSALPTR